MKKKMGNTPTEIIHLNFINLLIQCGKSEAEILHYGLNGIEDRTQKSRSKKMLESLLKEVQNPNKIMKTEIDILRNINNISNGDKKTFELLYLILR